MDLLMVIWDKMQTVFAYALATLVVWFYVFIAIVAWAMLERFNLFLDRFL